MSDSAHERLQRLLGGDPLRSLRARLRERYARGLDRDSFTLHKLDAVERRTLEGLLGLPLRSAGSMRLSRTDLDIAIRRAGLAVDLRDALERLDGPIADRRAERAERMEAWREAIVTARDPRLQALLQRPVAQGLLKRVAGGDPVQARALLAAADSVLQRLPVAGGSLARLAADCTGDAHALDDGRGLAALVLRAALAAPHDRIDVPEPEDDPLDGTRPESRRRSRDDWALLGIAVNPLAAPALLLNLPVEPIGAAALIGRAAELGEPFHLSLRALLAEPPRWRVADVDVFVCENADIVVAAADRLGRRCAPLLCTDGMPSAAQRVLLQQLSAAGARLHVHADFDWPGLRIAGYVMRTFGARPWRFGQADYLAGDGGRPAGQRPQTGPALFGDPVRSGWDPLLSAAMQARGIARHEESVIDQLMQDLLASDRCCRD